MEPVVEFKAVSVRRGAATLLDAVDWVVEEDERWVVLGPNGAGKTTLMQIASAQLHPSEGDAHVLGERMGATDVFELRPRIGLASASLAERIPRGEAVRDVIVSASYGVAKGKSLSRPGHSASSVLTMSICARFRMSRSLSPFT